MGESRKRKMRRKRARRRRRKGEDGERKGGRREERGAGEGGVGAETCRLHYKCVYMSRRMRGLWVRTK